MANSNAAIKTLRELARKDLSNALDAIARDKIQQNRMPFDHDNTNALERYETWAQGTRNAIDWLDALKS